MILKSRAVSTMVVVITLLIFGPEMVLADMVQPRKLVNAHTAGVLPKAYYDLECRVYPAVDPQLGSGLLLGLSVGVTDRLNFGVSYGGDGLIGTGRHVKFNPFPGVLVKYRIIEESFIAPGFAIGYEHQGYGGIVNKENSSYNGYVYKSQGFFLGVSKNFLLLNFIQLGFHGTANYSLEERDRVRWPNVNAGVDLGFNEELAIVLEYDFGLNYKDPGATIYGHPGEGYLNAGLKWAFAENFYMEFNALDILENKEIFGQPASWTRELKLTYVSHF